jgi:hypothetical protein
MYKGKAKMKYKIFEGYDHYNNYPLFKVIGIDNDYVGEWHKNKEDATKELIGIK